jgi:exodeoxyribonuclease-3
VRIATWNVNGLRARLDFALHWLRAREPDLVGFQELKLEDAQFPHDAFSALGYRVVTHGQKSWNGVAIASREPLDVIESGLPGCAELGARLITARSASLVFCTVYVPNGKHLEHEDYARKLAWLDALAAHVAATRKPEEAFVLCGDLNLCPTALDSCSEPAAGNEIFHTPAERERFRALERWGLVDLYRAQHPERRAYSWWDYRAGAFHKNEGLRIDFLLGTAAVRARLAQIEIDREYRKKQGGMSASDHAPVYADLD